MKKFIETIYFNREKEENWDIEKRGERLGFESPQDLVYLGYEVCMEVEVCENLSHKVLRINGCDVSDKNIYV